MFCSEMKWCIVDKYILVKHCSLKHMFSTHYSTQDCDRSVILYSTYTSENDVPSSSSDLDRHVPTRCSHIFLGSESQLNKMDRNPTYEVPGFCLPYSSKHKMWKV
jgi:hypothetical protein